MSEYPFKKALPGGNDYICTKVGLLCTSEKESCCDIKEEHIQITKMKDGMNDDLISRSAFIESLIHCDGLGRKSLEAVIKTIKEQTTAYDVDKVVEALEGSSYIAQCLEVKTRYVNLGKAIEIVKGGGVNE